MSIVPRSHLSLRDCRMLGNNIVPAGEGHARRRASSPNLVDRIFRKANSGSRLRPVRCGSPSAA